VQVNFITRSGSNNFTGFGRLFNTNDSASRRSHLPGDQRHRG